MNLSLVASAFLLGLILNAAPGAVFAETVRRGMHGGFGPAFAVQVGSLVGDATWAVLGLAGIGLLLRSEGLQTPVAVAGALYLAWLARDSWRAASSDELAPPPPGVAEQKALRAGALLSLTNPQNLAYWAAVGSALGSLGVKSPTLADEATFLLGFMGASVFWCFFCAGLVNLAFRHAGPGWTRLTHRLCAVAFALLALGSLAELRH